MGNTWQPVGGTGTAVFQTEKYGTIEISMDAFRYNPAIADINTGASTYHEYRATYNTGIYANQFPIDEIGRLLRAQPTPFNQNFAGPGVVFQAAPDSLYGNVNVTESGWHILDPGVVMRRVIVVDGKYVIETVGIGDGYLGWFNTLSFLTEPVWDYTAWEGIANNPSSQKQDLRCFPSSTPIQTSLTSTTSISSLRVGDVVLAFDPYTENGRGALVPRRVTKLFSNITTEWVKLSWVEAGVARELVATPGHHFLDQFGNFPPIAEMITGGGATVVLASGELAEVVATRIVYSQATAHLFEQAQSHIAVSGNTALKPQMLEGWQTYNFEVEDLHTYVAESSNDNIKTRRTAA